MQQAIQRILMMQSSLSLKQVVRFLTYKDGIKNKKRERTFYFVVEAHDLEDIIAREHHGFTWVKPIEAVGYPIREDLREVIELYMELKKLP